MTRCRKCGRGTRRPYAAYCDDCRGWKTVPFTTEMDEQLRRVYARADYPALGVLAKRWGMPRWRLTHRAQRLGIAATKEPRWSEEEIKILERNHHLTPRIIAAKLRARGYRRSETGVVLKRKRLRLRKADRGYSASGLAVVMGVDRGMVLRWIERGLLGAQRLPSERPAGAGSRRGRVVHPAAAGTAIHHRSRRLGGHAQVRQVLAHRSVDEQAGRMRLIDEHPESEDNEK